jgi:hypothetical protein
LRKHIPSCEKEPKTAQDILGEGPLAHLVERRFCTAEARSSNLLGSTTVFRDTVEARSSSDFAYSSLQSQNGESSIFHKFRNMEEIKAVENKEAELIVSNLETLFARLAQLKSERGTLWFGITGSWIKTNEEVENNVREAVQQIIGRGDGIVSGGALNVDFFATDEALRLNPTASRIKIFLPVVLDLYAAHYRKRATEGVITSAQAEVLVAQLESLRAANPDALISNPQNTVVDLKTYFERNTEVVNASDALVGFQVNDSKGVNDTVKKAMGQGKPVCLKKFIIE